jgi:cytochrome c oxidase assembly protein subunit 15
MSPGLSMSVDYISHQQGWGKVSEGSDQMLGVRIWLWVCAALVFLMVLVGGATRLTESGLSITEWKLVTGILPPLTEADWLKEFDAYKQIPQYSQLFPDMDLARFKFIFYWEWGHRLLGRLIGLVFALPLLWFWLKGYLNRSLALSLLGVLALGGLQGAVGWWMVKSGLSGRVEVAPERLATHLLLASITFTCLVWIATGLKSKTSTMQHKRLRWSAYGLLLLVLLQICLGALVAGLRAGLTYNSWPLMDGRFIPPLDHLLQLDPAWLNLFENVTTVQFDHRMLAYGVFIFVLVHAWDVWRIGADRSAFRRALALLALVTCQIGLGIVTLLLVMPEGRIPLHPALTHQALALLVLGMSVVHARRLTPDRA